MNQSRRSRKRMFRNIRAGVSHRPLVPTSGIVTSQTRSAHITPKGWLVSWGSNTFSGLGHDKNEPFQAFPIRVGIPKVTPETALDTVIKPLDESASEDDFADISDVACGWATNMAVTKDGKVYQWGFSKRVQDLISAIKFEQSSSFLFDMARKLGWYNPNKPAMAIPQRVLLFGVKTYKEFKAVCELMNQPVPDEKYFDPEEYRAKTVVCGSDCSAVITATGSLYTWANTGDLYGKTGHGGDKSMLPYKFPRRVELPGPVVSVSFGFNHMAALLKDGSLYTSGLGTSGALGLPTFFVETKKEFRQVSPPECVNDNVKTFFIDLKEALETNKYGLYKDFRKEAATPSPDILKATSETTSTSASIAADSPQPSSSPLADITKKEKEIADQDAKVRARQEFLSNVTEAVEKKGSETKEGTNNPLRTLQTHGSYSLPTFKDVSCGFSHTCALDHAGMVWSMGRNNHGELGLVLHPANDEGKGNIDAHAGVNTGLTPVDFRLHYVPTPVQALKDMNVKIAKISCGHHHTIALSEDGEVYTWGSNEYGQCGRLHEQPSTLRSQVTKQQPWALPPGKLRISASVLRDSHIVDVKAGFYDSVVIFSDGRALVFGSYLSDKSSPRSMFLLEHFEPKTPTTGKAARYLVQTLGSKDLAPPPQYVYAQEQQEPALSVMYGGRYELKKIEFGLHYAVAVAVPREEV